MSKHVACGLAMSNFQPEENVVMVVTFAFTERTAKRGLGGWKEDAGVCGCYVWIRTGKKNRQKSFFER